MIFILYLILAGNVYNRLLQRKAPTARGAVTCSKTLLGHLVGWLVVLSLTAL